MNPKQTFSDLLAALMRGEVSDAAENAIKLAEWIKKGGFVPQALTDAYVVVHSNGRDDDKGRAP